MDPNKCADKIILLLVAMLVALSQSACSAFFTVVPLNKEHQLSEGGSATNKNFDKVAFVDKIWDSKVLPTAKSKAIDLDTLYTSLKLNPDDASQKYGNRIGGPYNFLTQFEGKITAVNTASRAGTMTVETQAGGNLVQVTVQIGPVIPSTSIRDAVGFITFNDVVNQLQFADVADELNTRAYNMSLKGKTFDSSLIGKTASVTGAFALDNLDALAVTPVYLDIK